MGQRILKYLIFTPENQTPRKSWVIVHHNKTVWSRGLIVEMSFLDLNVVRVCFPAWEASQVLSLIYIFFWQPFTKSFFDSLAICAMLAYQVFGSIMYYLQPWRISKHPCPSEFFQDSPHRCFSFFLPWKHKHCPLASLHHNGFLKGKSHLFVTKLTHTY